MKLIDLNIDCLEGVLEHLQIEDLLNAADANKRLSHAASFLFDRKYGRKYLTLGFRYNFNIFQRGSFQTFNRINFEFSIGNERLCGSAIRPAFQLLRCFGRSIYSVQYLFHEDCNEDHEIYFCLFDYIEKYCSETLNDFHINFCLNHSKILLFKKPFVKVENLCISLISKRNNSNLCGAKEISASTPLNITKDCLVKIFPKIRNLRIEILTECSEFIHSGCLANNFPYLENLDITDAEMEKCDKCIEIYADLLRLNPQLKSLYIHQDIMNMKIFQSTNESLQNLEHLDICFHFFIKNFNGKKPLKSLKHLRIGGNWPEETCVNPFLCDQLESLTIDMDFEPYRPIEYFNPYFEENQSIRSLYLQIPNEDLLNSLIQNQTIFTNRFPYLEIFELIIDNKISIAKVLDTVAMFEKLTCFKFKVNDESECKSLQNYLKPGEWSSSYSESTYYTFIGRCVTLQLRRVCEQRPHRY